MGFYILWGTYESYFKSNVHSTATIFRGLEKLQIKNKDVEQFPKHNHIEFARHLFS